MQGQNVEDPRPDPTMHKKQKLRHSASKEQTTRQKQRTMRHPSGEDGDSDTSLCEQGPDLPEPYDPPIIVDDDTDDEPDLSPHPAPGVPDSTPHPWPGIDDDIRDGPDEPTSNGSGSESPAGLPERKRKRTQQGLPSPSPAVDVSDVLQILPVVNNEGHRHIVKTVLPVLKNIMLQEEHCRKPPRQQGVEALLQLQSRGETFWGVHQIYAQRKTVVSIVTSHYYDSARALMC